MDDVILTDIKGLLTSLDDDSFDHDIMFHINGTYTRLRLSGADIPTGFKVTSDGNQKWIDMLPTQLDEIGASVKQYIHLKVKLIFDPPANSFTVTSLKEQMKDCLTDISLYSTTGGE